MFKCNECGKEYINNKDNKKFCSWECLIRFKHKQVFKDGKKLCSKCKQWKPLNEFYKDKTKKSKLKPCCGQCNRDGRNNYGGTVGAIWPRLKRRNKHICTRELFILWYNNQNKKCVYCDITEENWLRLYGSKYPKKIKRLTIDRMNNDLGYVLDNLALACYHCNFIKSDFLNFDEMREIGQRYIKPKWLTKTMEVANV